jgi:signal transduction histidine kinase
MIDMNENIKDAQQQKDDFIYIIAHDLNAPIRHIKSFIEILLKDFDGQLSTEQQEYKDIILKAADDAQAMITGLLELSRFQPSTALEVIDIDALILTIIEKFDREIHFENKLAADETVRGDLHMLQKGLTQIIENAFVHNQGHEALDVQIRIDKDNENRIKILISDNGRGVPEHIIEKLTRPFFSLEDGHLGLGLAFAEKALTVHNAQLQFFINDKGGLTAEILFIRL